MKKLSVVLLALVFPFVLQAQGPGKFTGSLLWKVSGNGLERPSYIFGTHHMAHISFLDGIGGLEEALNNTDRVVGELLMADKDDIQVAMAARMMMPEGQSYRDMLSEDDYYRLDEGLKTVMKGTGLDKMGALHPAAVDMIVTVAIFTKCFPAHDMRSHVSPDEHFQRLAAEEGKECLALETIDEQIYALFDAMSLDMQSEALVCSVTNIPFIESMMKKMTEHYYLGELDSMYYLSHNNPDDPCPLGEEMKIALEDERNGKWLEKLPSIMDEAPSFIAVGALHLTGEEGLLFRLDKMGYSVEAVE